MIDSTWMMTPWNVISINLPLIDCLEAEGETWAVFSDGKHLAIAELLDGEPPILGKEPEEPFYLTNEVITGPWAERILFSLRWKCTP